MGTPDPSDVAHPPAVREHRQPHRRRRGDRAAGRRHQGTGGERAGRRRDADRRLPRRRRHRPAGGHRQRHRHVRRGTGAVRAAPRHLQADRRDAGAHHHAGVPRRGAALDRRGGAVADHLAAARRRSCLRHHGGGRPCRGRRADRRVGGDTGGGAGPVLRHAGAAQIPEIPAHRGRTRRGGGPPAGAVGAGRGVPAGTGRPRGVRGAGAGADRAGRRAAGGGGRRRDAAGARGTRHPGGVHCGSAAISARRR